MLSVDLVGIQFEPSTGSSVLVLREHDAPHRVLPIVVGGADAASIALAVQGQTAPRPLTHDVMATLVERFDGHLDAVELVDLRGGAFVANLAVSGPTGDLRLDTRPSDAIALAVRLRAPLFVSEHVLDAAGAAPVPDSDTDSDDTGSDDTELDATQIDAIQIDATEIDAQVDRFREFLDRLDPGDFGGGPDDGGDAEADADIGDAGLVETEADVDDEEEPNG